MGDDKQREIEELERRLANLKASPIPQEARRTAERSDRRLLIGLVVGIGIFVATAFGYEYWANHRPPLKQPIAETNASNATCNDTWSSLIYGSALQSGLVQDGSVEATGIVLIVDRRIFDRTSFEDQTKLAVAVDCGAAGNGRHVNSVRFRTSPGSSDIARFDAADLMRARERQFSR